MENTFFNLYKFTGIIDPDSIYKQIKHIIKNVKEKNNISDKDKILIIVPDIFYYTLINSPEILIKDVNDIIYKKNIKIDNIEIALMDIFKVINFDGLNNQDSFDLGILLNDRLIGRAKPRYRGNYSIILKNTIELISKLILLKDFNNEEI